MTFAPDSSKSRTAASAAAHRGVKQRRIAAGVGEVDVRMVFQKHSHDAQMTAHRSVGNGRHPVGTRSVVHPEATIEQQPDDTHVAPKRRGVQGPAPSLSSAAVSAPLASNAWTVFSSPK